MEFQKPKEEKGPGTKRKKLSEVCNLLDLPATLIVEKGDITKADADAIVNAANTGLMGGGGVDGAIHAAGGPAIMEACQKIRQERGGIATGEAVLTTGGQLSARFVIHTAGPVWHGGKNGESRLLAKCYRNSLLLADKHKLQHIAFPNISTGVYGFPKNKAAEVALKTVCKYLKENKTTLKKVRFICFDEENMQLYQQLVRQAQEG